MEDINKESNHEKLKYLKHDCSFIEKSEELNLNKKKRRAVDWREPPGAGVVDGK
jgi:hypothetical protein